VRSRQEKPKGVSANVWVGQKVGEVVDCPRAQVADRLEKLAHGGNPVTRWMAANVAVAQDPAGNLKTAKDKSTEPIDGIVAIIMAIGRAMLVQGEQYVEYQMVPQ
jgi:phage terminase large subunit-like protein